MHSLLVVFHVFAMVTSLVVMASAIAGALFGYRKSLRVAGVGVVLATAGTLTGALLMIQAPVLHQCAILTAYLVAMVSLYAYGFGWGTEEKAKLLHVMKRD